MKRAGIVHPGSAEKCKIVNYLGWLYKHQSVDVKFRGNLGVFCAWVGMEAENNLIPSLNGNGSYE